MSISRLPNELLLQITSSLPSARDVYALARASRLLAAIAIPILHERALEDKDGLTALQWATFRQGPRAPAAASGRARGGHEGLVRLLLAKGVDVDYFDPNPGSYFLRHSESIDFYRCSPAIHRAVMYGQISILRILLDHGANINLANARGDTALDLALHSNEDEGALVLLDRGADISRPKDNYGSQKALQIAARSCSYAVVSRIVEMGGDVNDRDEDGTTVLHSAVQGTTAYENDPRISIVRLLLESGAEVSVQDNDGMVPLHYAAETGAVKVIRLLLDHGAEMEVVSYTRRTPLLEAVIRLKKDAVKMLLEAGADSIFVSTEGKTVIDSATFGARDTLDRQTSLDLIQVFLDAPGQLKKYLRYKPNGGSLMCWAAKGDHDDIVRMLLDNGVDISAQQKGWYRSGTQPPTSDFQCEGTALHWAAMSGSQKVARLLLERGIDDRIKANVGQRTALEWAMSCRRPEIISVLFEFGRGYENSPAGLVSRAKAPGQAGKQRPAKSGYFARRFLCF